MEGILYGLDQNGLLSLVLINISSKFKCQQLHGMRKHTVWLTKLLSENVENIGRSLTKQN